MPLTFCLSVLSAFSRQTSVALILETFTETIRARVCACVCVSECGRQGHSCLSWPLGRPLCSSKTTGVSLIYRFSRAWCFPTGAGTPAPGGGGEPRLPFQASWTTSATRERQPQCEPYKATGPRSSLTVTRASCWRASEDPSDAASGLPRAASSLQD